MHSYTVQILQQCPRLAGGGHRGGKTPVVATAPPSGHHTSPVRFLPSLSIHHNLNKSSFGRSPLFCWPVVAEDRSHSAMAGGPVVTPLKLGAAEQWYESSPQGLAAERWTSLCAYHIMKRVTAAVTSPKLPNFAVLVVNLTAPLAGPQTQQRQDGDVAAHPEAAAQGHSVRGAARNCCPHFSRHI